MGRSCKKCQHLKRPEIDRRLAAGEPVAQLARDYELNPPSLHRHRKNCLKLAPANEIKKEAARGSAAVALLPSKEILSGNYLALIPRIDQIVDEAKEQQSLRVALSGLTDIRKTLDSLTRLAGHDRAAAPETETAAARGSDLDVAAIAARLIQEFDQDPEIKARIAQVLLTMDQDTSAAQAAASAGTAETETAPMAVANAQPAPPEDNAMPAAGLAQIIAASHANAATVLPRSPVAGAPIKLPTQASQPKSVEPELAPASSGATPHTLVEARHDPAA
jgi:hypothetical protein